MFGAVLSTFFSLMLLAAPARETPGVITVDGSSGEVALAPLAEYFFDPSGRITPAGALTSGPFKPHRGRAFTFGHRSEALWVRWTVHNRSRDDFFLEIPQPATDRIDFYRVKSGKITGARERMGDVHPFSRREIAHRNFVFAVAPSPEPETLLFRIESTSYLSFNPVLRSRSAFEAADRGELAVMWAFFGMMAVMALYNLLLVVSVRDEGHVFYVLLILAYAVHIFSCKGYAFQHFWPDSPNWGNISSKTLLFLILVMILGFSRYFLELKEKSPLLDRAILGSGVFAAAVMGSLLVFDTTVLLNAGYVVFNLICLALAVHALLRALRGDRPALFYFISWAGLLASVSLGTLYINGTVTVPFLSKWSVQVGGLWQILFLSFAQADRINTMRRNLAELNTSLEKKVDSRTRELQEAMNELMEAHLTSRRDMEMAVSVQKNFLPREAPAGGDWDAALVFRPMAGVSGDFYDFYSIDGKFVGAGVFDVSGHGVSSGLVTMIAKSLLYNNFRRGLHEGLALSEIVIRANRDLMAEIGNVGYFITAVIVKFNGGSLEYVNAGHPEMYIKNGGSIRHILDKEGLPVHEFYLGLDQMDFTAEKTVIDVSPGECLFMYTDCLVETKDASGEPYGTGRLLQALASAPGGTAGEIVGHVMADFDSFRGSERPLRDDLTVLALLKK